MEIPFREQEKVCATLGAGNAGREGQAISAIAHAQSACGAPQETITEMATTPMQKTVKLEPMTLVVEAETRAGRAQQVDDERELDEVIRQAFLMVTRYIEKKRGIKGAPSVCPHCGKRI